MYEDMHGQEGLPGSYKRYELRCPLGGSEHSELGLDGKSCRICEKRRNIGPAQTANFGAYEPLGYLGAWAKSAGQFESRGDHIRFKPNKQMVREYIVAQGWPMDSTNI